jgi:opacity protein-like surface antigen
MLRKTLYATLTVSLLLVSASTADAQFASPIRFNVHAGGALPVGDSGDAYDLGFRVGAGLELRPAFSPVGLRFDGAFDRMPVDPDQLLPGEGDVNVDIWSVTANAVVAPPVSPLYFIGGIGFYSASETDTDSETDFGFNVGAGLQLPLTGFSTFIEARFHQINVEGGNFRYVPIVFGIRF